MLSSDPNGTWTLQIQDQAFVDGGFLNRWSLDLVLESQGRTKRYARVFDTDWCPGNDSGAGGKYRRPGHPRWPLARSRIWQ
ncbi:proprotein convertase P-domain-containing protein [Leptolyngbya cf. ectocarpi LEGE 11479]|uniref:Proprotein convertase P-domain-containing protein n=1 Tax=Leptolyngbya cf. ectocarpi LEGE 11479 TaxID=1828722 RepID=A0A928WZY0_LEPEC|nr:proprotein convertase P-domain-containing protein [Leptolyngbya cf. ectocarpi LEGE 11479]